MLNKMLNKMLLTTLVLMLNYTTAYAWVDSTKRVADLIVQINAINGLQTNNVVVTHRLTGTTQECTPIDWVGKCQIDTLSSGIGEYYAAVSFAVTAPLNGFHCDYFGRTSYFYFNGVDQQHQTINLNGRCYRLDSDDETATTTD
jgi:hypothetical protein